MTLNGMIEKVEWKKGGLGNKKTNGRPPNIYRLSTRACEFWEEKMLNFRLFYVLSQKGLLRDISKNSEPTVGEKNEDLTKHNMRLTDKPDKQPKNDTNDEDKDERYEIEKISAK